MENPKISIIMPVYNVEKYLPRAIESMLAQTFTDFEFFAVDDGSTDNSGKVCDEYAIKDGRIHVIHKENGGAPSARNAAMEIAKGDYFYFFDSDDWAEPTMLEDMYQLAVQHQAQLVVTGFYIDTYYSDDEYVRSELWESNCVFDTQRSFRENAYKLFDKNLLYSPWNKLYLASYIREKSLKFPNTFWDDFPFVLSVVRDIEKVVVSSKRYYHFIRSRQESETAKYRPNMYEKREEEHEWMIDLYQYWNVSDPQSVEMVQRRYIERVVGCIENITNKGCTLSRKEKIQKIKKILVDPKVPTALKLAKPRSGLMKCMLLPIRMKSAHLSYMEGVFISYIKSSNVKTFATLKQNR